MGICCSRSWGLEPPGWRRPQRTPSLLGGLRLVSGCSGTVGWDVGLLINIPPTHPRPEGPPPLPHPLHPTPDCSTAGHTKKTPRIVVYCNTFITLLSTVELIWDPAVFHVTAESLGRKPEPEGGGVTPCILFHYRDILPKRNSVVLVNDAFRRGDKLHYTMLI